MKDAAKDFRQVRPGHAIDGSHCTPTPLPPLCFIPQTPSKTVFLISISPLCLIFIVVVCSIHKYLLVSATGYVQSKLGLITSYRVKFSVLTSEHNLNEILIFFLNVHLAVYLCCKSTACRGKETPLTLFCLTP